MGGEGGKKARDKDMNDSYSLKTKKGNAGQRALQPALTPDHDHGRSRSHDSSRPSFKNEVGRVNGNNSMNEQADS